MAAEARRRTGKKRLAGATLYIGSNACVSSLAPDCNAYTRRPACGNACRDRRRNHGRLWKIPESRHLGGLEARPRAYESRVVGIFDRALLGAPTAER